MRRLALASATAATIAALGAAPPCRAADPDRQSSESAARTSSDPWLGRDKALHFGVSTGIAGAGYGFAAIGAEDLRVRIAFGAGSVVVLGAAKEIFDLAGFGTPSWKDFAWDLIGAVVGVGISLSIDLAVRSLSPRPAATRSALRL